MGGGLVSFIPPPQNKPLKSLPRWGLNGFKLTFDRADVLSFLGKDFAQNVAIVGADSIFSSHSENCVDNFLILDEGY